MKEEDSFYITLINNYTQLVGITKKVKGHLSITRIGDNLLEAPPLDFYLFLFETYCSKLNWGCSDRYPEGGIIQASFPFSIYLVQKYGDQKRSPVFYAEKIIRAYPRSLMDFKGGYSTKEDEILKCYCTRVLERFMKRFGLITIVGQDDWIYMIRKEYTIQKNELMDELITWEKDASTRIG
ncbi:MAG: hypothetical protein Q7J68_07610 [Thermoplasmata archaeon]|nr:hypothetical protein [Thermoplasmata archaeon]